MKINSWQEKSAHTDLSLQCVAGHCCSSFALVSFRLLSKVTQRFSIQTQWKRYFLPFLFFHRFCLFWLRFFSKTPLIVQVQNSRHIMAEIVPTNSLEAWMNFGRFFCCCLVLVLLETNDHCQVVMNLSGYWWYECVSVCWLCYRHSSSVVPDRVALFMSKHQATKRTDENPKTFNLFFFCSSSEMHSHTQYR